MKLSTGKVAFPLHFDNGDVENIYINPHDPNLQDRIKGFEASLKSRLEALKLDKYAGAFSSDIDISTLSFKSLMELPPDEFEKVQRQIEAIDEIGKDVQKQVCDELDAVFDTDVSSKAFKYVPPFETVQADESGETVEIYIMLVLEALAEEIQKYNGRMSEATKKYTDKYSKKK